MQKKKKFTEESITNKDYIELFSEIKQCGMRAWDKRSKEEKKKKPVIIIEHSAYSSYTVLDFKNLYDYLIKLLGGDKKRKIGFEDAIDNLEIQWTTFRQGQSRNISADKVKAGLEAAAEFFDIALIQLLADFLTNCEDDVKKKRLDTHAQYEEIIKSFVREAPELVAQLEAESVQTFAQDAPKQQNQQTATENRHVIDRVEGKEKWLDPYNFDELPLVGRDKEWELLDSFANHNNQFEIWAISGPSGSGKTRLASQWGYSSKELDGWDCRVLHKEDRTDLKKWANWTPDKPTLIIIDYLYGFEEVALKLMGFRLEPTAPKIRLLLIDHVFSEPLHSDKRWGFSGDGSSLNRNEKYFFDLKPLDLEKIPDQKQKEIIIKIIARRAGLNIKNHKVDKAHEYLLNTEGAYRPLFAALLGDAIKLGKEDFLVWNRRELISYYLSGERLPWKLGTDKGRWASYFIAVATARRGVAYKSLSKAASNCVSVPEHFVDVKEICQKVVTDKNTITLKPFEPDILGESFFLEFLKFLKFTDSSIYQEEFQQVFMAGDEDTQTKDAIAFIAFIQRLTRNLLNDDQSQKETQELWDTLFNFMCPSEFENTETIKWALTIGVIDIVNATQGKFPKEKLIALLNQADPAALYRVHNPSLLRYSVLYSMHCFELTSNLTKTKSEISEEMTALFDRYNTQIDEDGGLETPLILASIFGFCEIINTLIDHGVDIEAKNFGDVNEALIYACEEGQIEAVKQLIHAQANIYTTDCAGWTALHVASHEGYIEIVKLLLDKDADIIHTTIDIIGLTALHLACMRVHVEIVKLLLNKDADIIHVTDNSGDTALHWASGITLSQLEGYDDFCLDWFIDLYDGEPFQPSEKDNIEVVKLLLDKDADIIYAVDNNGQTALHWASHNGRVEIAKLLLDKDANIIHAADNFGCTPLHLASIDGCVEFAKLLLDKDADIIHAVDSKGQTALHYACELNHVEVAKLLLDKDADIIRAVDNEGKTALYWASMEDCVEIAKLLLDKDADIIHTADNEGETALHWASHHGQVEIAKLVLDKDADIIDVTDNGGDTALISACGHNQYRHIETIKLLLKRKARVNVVNCNGHTALSVAKEKGHEEIIKLLIEHAVKD